MAAVFDVPVFDAGAAVAALDVQEEPSPPQTPHLSTVVLPNGTPLQSTAQVLFFPPQTPHRS